MAEMVRVRADSDVIGGESIHTDLTIDVRGHVNGGSTGEGIILGMKKGKGAVPHTLLAKTAISRSKDILGTKLIVSGEEIRSMVSALPPLWIPLVIILDQLVWMPLPLKIWTVLPELRPMKAMQMLLQGTRNVNLLEKTIKCRSSNYTTMKIPY